MSQALWYVKDGEGERGPFSTDQLRRMAENGEIRPDTPVQKGSRRANRSARQSFGWEEARGVRFLAGLFEASRVDGDQRRNGNAALSEFIPNFDPAQYDEGSLEVFRRIVEGVNRLREPPPSRSGAASCPFSLTLNRSEWDADTVSLLSQLEHAIEQLRAAMNDGTPLPPTDFVFRFDESIFDDDFVVFVRRIQSALNGLRKGQSPRAVDSQQTLFDLSQAQSQSRKEATAPSKSAAVPCRKDILAWQELVVAARDIGQHGQAVELAKEGVREYPRSDWLWRILGGELTELDRLDEAEKALNTARSLNPNADWLWRFFAGLHRKRKNLEGEIESLETVCSLGAPTWYDLNQLGIAYHNHRDLASSLKYYRLAAAKSEAAPWVNLGLVYSDPELSQDTDAADAYRRALALTPDYERAKELLQTTKRKLVPLADQVQTAATGLIQTDECFEFYISPLEVLQIEEAALVGQPDVKAIQHAKTRLLHELDLNDGKVGWINDYPLDKSRALAMEDELHDEAKRRYHAAVFQNKQLLHFLTRGDVRHFLYSDGYFPCDTEELLHCEPGFRAFLSRPFAKQYNRVLARAIERRLLPVVEALFDGRRWVEPKDEDLCFEGAFKRISDLVELMRSKVQDGCSRKVSLREMDDFLRQHSFPELFNLLPAHFASYQSDVVAEIRCLAIACFNQHGDPNLSKGVLTLCKRFTPRSVALTRRLEEDFKSIEEKISEDRKHSFSALVRPGQAVDVGRTGIRIGNETINSAEVEIIRWGIFIRTVNGAEREHSFSLVVGSADKVLRVEWDMRGLLGDITGFFRKNDDALPITQLTTRAQQAQFEMMIDAVLHNLVPAVLEKMMVRFQAGRKLVVGPCTLTNAGIAFSTGVLFQTTHLLPWQDVDTQTGGGQVTVISRTNRNARVSMAAKDTDNAVILPILSSVMREQHSQHVAQYESNGVSFNKKAFLGWMSILAVIVIIAIVAISISRKTAPDAPTKTAPSRRSYTPPVSPSDPAYSPAFTPSTPASESKSVYRIPNAKRAELDRESQAIDTAKATAERMAKQLESLGWELKQTESYLDRTSQFEVDDFNRKVDAYNNLLERVRAQDRLVNQLVESYNEKLRQHGR